jgi:hypothetical protein
MMCDVTVLWCNSCKMAYVPSFVLDILDSEVRQIQISLLNRVASDYNIEPHELIDRYLPQTQRLDVTPSSKTKVEVIRRLNPKPPAGDSVRCLARIWNRGNGGQCTRERKEDCEYCGHHMKLVKEEGILRHGRIDQQPPHDVFGESQGPRRKALTK